MAYSKANMNNNKLTLSKLYVVSFYYYSINEIFVDHLVNPSLHMI